MAMGFSWLAGAHAAAEYLAGIPNLWYYEEELVSSRGKGNVWLEQLILACPPFVGNRFPRVGSRLWRTNLVIHRNIRAA